MLEKPNMINLLSSLKSAIAFDLAPLHTGIVTWNGTSIEEYGFKLPPIEQGDVFGVYKLRRNLKNQLIDLLKGRHFEYCIVEDTYAGENYTTIRELDEINTVPDECLFDGVFTVDNFFRWKPTSWLSKARVFYKQKVRLTSKYEIQSILEYLEYDFVLENKDKSDKYKNTIFYEDICDAAGMLLSLVSYKNFNENISSSRPVPISKVKLVYLQCTEDTCFSRDKRVKNEDYRLVNLDLRHLEKSISETCGTYPDDVLCALVPPNKLGNFGLKHKLEYYDSDEAFLFFYKKS